MNIWKKIIIIRSYTTYLKSSLLFDVCILLMVWLHVRPISPKVEELPQRSMLVDEFLQYLEQFLVHTFAINKFPRRKHVVCTKQTLIETLLNKKQMSDEKH